MTKIYKGVHGTCRTWGNQIKQNGFTPSSGFFGVGAYFWRYYHDDAHAKFYAFKWWEYKNKKGDYNKSEIRDKNCALLNCFFDINKPTEVLDLTDGLEKEKLISLINDEYLIIKQQGIKQNIDEEKDQHIKGVLAIYLDKMEEKQGSKFKIIIVDHANPKGAGGVLGKFFGTSMEVLIVRDPACIQLESIQEINHYEHI